MASSDASRPPRVSGPVGRVRAQLRARPLSVRLAILTGSLTALVVAASFSALSLGVRSRTRGILAEQLRSTQRTIAGMQRGTVRQLMATSLLVGQSPALRAAMETYRLESSGRAQGDALRTIQNVVESLAGDVDQGIVIVTDSAGRVLAATRRGGPAPLPGADLSSLPAVRRALDGAGPAADSGFVVAELSGARLYLGAAPILQRGFLVGTLLLGEELDPDFIRRLTEDESAEVVVRSDTDVWATSLPGGVGEAVRTAPATLLAEAARGTGSARLGNDDYVVTSMPLALDASGRPVTLFFLRSLTLPVRAFQVPLLRNFLLYGVLAVALATLAAALVSRSVLRSFRDFVGFMGSVARSRDYTRRFHANEAPGEIRTLVNAYEHLITSLAESHGQLSEANEQLRQSQKLEAIGNLAGGVAHDFNNVLTVIHSYAELAMANVNRQDPQYHDLDQIRQAASRAGRLTNQLLAFSRKQVLQPKVIDLNGIVTAIEKMLRRVIGEHIDLRVVSGVDLARVKADPGQIEQVLVNLAVNARDAMSRGGRLTIETANVTLTEKGTAEHGATPPGPWVRLSVSDTGIGMDRATLARIFEPFFTTKEVGRGTGLGLSTVYGIVKQSGGYIWASSEPGAGAVFRVYLPPVEGMAESWEPAPSGAAPRGGSETVLLVEDEDAVRALAARTLRERGYNVLAASDGRNAVEVADRHNGDIHLLLTDVVMPGMGGKELAESVVADRPETRVLFMSGYTDDTIVRHGVLDGAVSLLQKPFTPSSLALKVREVLDSPDPAPGVPR